MGPSNEHWLRLVTKTLALVTVIALVPLIAWDGSAQLFPARAHEALAAIPLAMIAVVCVVDGVVKRTSLTGLARAAVLAAAFLFWAANQFWPAHPHATVFNDIAVMLFVLDVAFAVPGGRAFHEGDAPRKCSTKSAATVSGAS